MAHDFGLQGGRIIQRARTRFSISERARIGRATLFWCIIAVTIGRATHISGPSLYAPL